MLAISFDERNYTAYGPAAFDVYTSADGFAASVLGGSLSPSAPGFTNHSATLGTAPYLGITGPFTVHISGYGGPSAPPIGVWYLDNIVLTVSTTPEPSALVLVALAALAALAFRADRI